MKRKNSLTYIIFLFIFCLQNISAQDSLYISVSEYMAAVKKYHPQIKSYRLQNNIAEWQLLRAQGAFDPVIHGGLAEKVINGDQYFEEKKIGIDIPIWYGISVSGAYQELEGKKLNNSDTKGGLYKAGIHVPIGKGLFFNEEIAAIQQARLLQEFTFAEQTLAINEFLAEAEIAYWNLVKNYEILQIRKKIIENNVERLQYINQSYELGERARIEITEAETQLQYYQLAYENALLDYQKSINEVNVYLWNDNQQIINLNGFLVPEETLSEIVNLDDKPILPVSALNNFNNHAYYQSFLIKNQLLENELRLKRQSFLPKLDFSYYFLQKENYNATIFLLFEDNFQYGLKLEIPIFQRQARANYKLAQAKIIDNQLEYAQKLRNFELKYNNYFLEIANSYSQYNLAKSAMDNYQKLYEAELIKNEVGESSLFLINSREVKWMESMEKFAEVQYKYIKAQQAIKYLDNGFIIDREKMSKEEFNAYFKK